MTSESNHNDPGVSEAYRGLANETTPPELDRKILSMAAAGQRSRYGLARAWVRPVAWAATIGLSLAFVLEMSQFQDAPVQQGEFSNEPAPDLETEVLDVDALEEVLVRDVAPAKARAPAAKQSAPAPANSEPVPLLEAEPAGDTASLSIEFQADDMSMLRDAEEQARSRVGSAQAPVEAAEADRFDALLVLEKKEKSGACDTATQASVETWYACIEELRDAGDADAAEVELAALVLKFPNFEVPGQNR